MRILKIAALCAVLGGCWASLPEMASTSPLGDQFVGQNVTTLVNQFGKPVSRKKNDTGQTLYVWELDAPTEAADDRRFDTGHAGLYGDGHTPGYMTDDQRLCKMTVMVSPEGIVTQVTTEDQNGTGAPSMTIGLSGGICAQRLRTKPRT